MCLSRSCRPMCLSRFLQTCVSIPVPVLEGNDMSIFTDREYLTKQQYSTSSNLDARIYLHSHYSTNPQGLKKWIFEKFALRSGWRVLELGSGTGDLWLENRDLLPPECRILLTDLSAGMLEKAKENLKAVDADFSFDTVDVQDIGYGDGTFDVVIANHMLYHVPDILKALTEIHRVLKPGGLFYAATNGINNMIELRQLIASIDPEAEMGTPGQYFGLENGGALLEQIFPKVELLRYEDALVVPEMQPILDYILSTKRSALIAKEPERAARFIQQKIDEDGAIRFTKDTGDVCGV